MSLRIKRENRTLKAKVIELEAEVADLKAKLAKRKAGEKTKKESEEIKHNRMFASPVVNPPAEDNDGEKKNDV